MNVQWTWNNDANPELARGSRRAVAVHVSIDRYRVELFDGTTPLLGERPAEPWLDAKARCERWVLRGER
jgi:hypothetical protein